MILILKSLWFFLPAIICNIFAYLSKIFLKNRFLFPVDFGKRFKDKAVFGKNKTYRGLLFGLASGIATVYLQFFLYSNAFFKSISIIDYSRINLFYFGVLMCFGALFGDLIESFVKRRLSIKPGKTFLIFDDIDFIMGAWLFSLIIITISIEIGIVCMALTIITKTICRFLLNIIKK